jgi:hypothetical protein
MIERASTTGNRLYFIAERGESAPLPKAYVEMGLLEEPPDIKKLYTASFLPSQ